MANPRKLITKMQVTTQNGTTVPDECGPATGRLSVSARNLTRLWGGSDLDYGSAGAVCMAASGDSVGPAGMRWTSAAGMSIADSAE